MQWQDRVAVIATMHQKELGMRVIVPKNFNTDIFGTFTRDIQRTGNQIEAARLKAEKILEQTGESIAIASEGSFAPHPAFPYVTSNKEIIIFIDKENDLEIIGEEFSIDTNHNHLVVQTLEQALKFAKKVGFPQHGLIAMSEESPKDSSHIFKGIITEKRLVEAINYILTKSSTGTVHLETDMRAMFNPTRMKNIAKATQNLVKKINSCCPKCHTPGFEITQRIEGLPCELCYSPTSLTCTVIYECKKCGYSEEKLFPDGKEFAEASLCMYCNP